MFCKTCGAKIMEGAKFCTACGCKINDKKIPRSMNEDGKILLVAEPQKKWFNLIITCGIIIMVSDMFLLLYAVSIENEADRKSGIEMSLMIAGAAIIVIYEGMKWAAMKITICENAVYGSYGYGISKQFKFTYDDIISVSGGNNSTNVITIVTKAKSYTLVHMEHASEAVKMICERINVNS